MTPDKDHIKKVFASKLKGIEQDPPAFMWERIESGLDAQVQKPKTRQLVYKIAGWSTAAAAAIAFGFFLFLPKDGGDLRDNHMAIIAPAVESEQPILQQAEPELPSAEKDIPVEKKSGQKQTTALFANINKSKNETEKSTSAISENLEEGGMINPAIPAFTKSADQEVLTASISIKNTEEKEQEGAVAADLQKQIEAFEAEGHKAEKLLAENIQSESVHSSHQGLALGVNGGGAFSKADGYKRTVMAMANADQQFSLRSETVKLEHNQPITFGLSVNKRINDRFSIESGITYAYLSSKIKSKSASSYSGNNTQYFHYLGIPLSLNYNIAEWNRLRLYISAGGAVQKDIYGRLDRKDGISQSRGSDKKNISQKNVQMSLTSSLGISYPIYGNMSVYTTVGGAYYIDAKNEYETIYSDKKWLLNLNLGVKFGF